MKNALEEFIQNNRDQFDTKAPDPAMLGRILDQMQQKENPKPAGGILIPFHVLRWAAVILVLIASSTAFWSVYKKSGTILMEKTEVAPYKKFTRTEINVPKQADPVETTGEITQKSEGHNLVEQDLQERRQVLLTKVRAARSNTQKQVIFAGLNDMESPANRIKAVSRTDDFHNNGNDIVDALIETLNTDPNANVRLAALDGLNRFYRERYVRKKLLASLKKQQDPVVQIALINFLSNIRESGVLEELERISSDENTQKIVKDCAYSGIIRLQSS